MMKLFLTVLTLFLGGFAQPNCDFVADISLILDQSGSVDNSELNMLKMAANNIVGALTISPQDSRAGVVRFSDTSSKVLSPLNGNAMTITNAVNSIGTTTGFTNISGALIDGWEILRTGLNSHGPPGARTPSPTTPPIAQVPRILFLFSDGMPNRGITNSADLIALAQRMKDGTFSGMAGNLLPTMSSTLPFPVTIFVVFIGGAGAAANLFQQIASPNSFFLVNDFGSFNPAQIALEFCETGTETFGDVHFTTHDGVMYTFNGGGDYVYMRSPEIEIHVRDVYVGRATSLAALAIQDKITGSVLEVWWDGKASEKLVVNVRPKNGDNKIVDYLNGYGDASPFHVFVNKAGQVKIRHSNYLGFHMLVNYGGRASFSVKMPREWVTEGLGGNHNGDKNDDICNRKGICASLNATNAEVHQIGLDWAVLPSEILFQNWMSVQDWEIRYHPLQINSEQLEAAKKFCEGVQPCIYDYISTGSEEYAGYTKQDYHDHIRNEEGFVYVGDKY